MARLMMIHGLGCDAGFWEPQMEALRAAGHEVEAPHLPYHGGPTEGVNPSLEGLAAWVAGEMGGRPAILLGHSLGGMIALEIAIDEPALVEGIVLVDAFANLRLNEANLPELWAPAYPELRDEIMRRRAEVLAEAEEVYEEIWATVLEYDATERLEEIRAPLLGIYGGRGRYALGDEERLKRDLLLDRTSGPAEVVIVEGAAHFVNLEEAERVNEAILRWLAARSSR
jgi:pimeloyl-ACP methyl ester carboxylesterase